MRIIISSSFSPFGNHWSYLRYRLFGAEKESINILMIYNFNGNVPTRDRTNKDLPQCPKSQMLIALQTCLGHTSLPRLTCLSSPAECLRWNNPRASPCTSPVLRLQEATVFVFLADPLRRQRMKIFGFVPGQRSTRTPLYRDDSQLC